MEIKIWLTNSFKSNEFIGQHYTAFGNTHTQGLSSSVRPNKFFDAAFHRFDGGN